MSNQVADLSEDPYAEINAGPHPHVVQSDPEAAKTGMWLFLFTEVLLFGGLFLVYIVYRGMHETAFHHAAAELNKTMGVVNTLVLLTSSLTMVISVNALQTNQIKKCYAYLWATLGFSVMFLVIKFFEWRAKYDHHIFPGTDHIHELPVGEGLFFNLYFMMTGLHGIHIIIGMIVMFSVMAKIKSGVVTPKNHGMLEYAGFTGIWLILFGSSCSHYSI